METEPEPKDVWADSEDSSGNVWYACEASFEATVVDEMIVGETDEASVAITLVDEELVACGLRLGLQTLMKCGVAVPCLM